MNFHQIDGISNDRTPQQSRYNQPRPNFYTCETSLSNEESAAVFGSGECASVVGKISLDRVLRTLKLSHIPNGTQSREVNRFGNHLGTNSTVCAVTFLYKCIYEKSNTIRELEITFYVMEREFPVLAGLTPLLAMKAALNLR